MANGFAEVNQSSVPWMGFPDVSVPIILPREHFSWLAYTTIKGFRARVGGHMFPVIFGVSACCCTARLATAIGIAVIDVVLISIVTPAMLVSMSTMSRQRATYSISFRLLASNSMKHTLHTIGDASSV